MALRAYRRICRYACRTRWEPTPASGTTCRPATICGKHPARSGPRLNVSMRPRRDGRYARLVGLGLPVVSHSFRGEAAKSKGYPSNDSRMELLWVGWTGQMRFEVSQVSKSRPGAPVHRLGQGWATRPGVFVIE